MTFTRTNSGLSNSAKFHGVDYLIYAEGGEYDVELKCSKWAIDTVFWGSIFSRYLPDLKYKFRAMGSKENIVPIAEKLSGAQISNAIVVMDRDHDSYRDCMIKHPCVIYTYGYSWENDAWRAELIISKLKKLAPERQITAEMAASIRERWNNFHSDFKRLVFVDVLCSLRRVKGVDREKYWGYVDQRDISRLRVKREKFRSLIRDVKSKRIEPFKYVGRLHIDSERDCYGKLLAKFCYEIFCESYKEITGAKNLARFDADIMIAEHFEYSDLSGEIGVDNYYAKTTRKLSNFLQA